MSVTKIYEHRALRSIIGPNSEEERRGLRLLHIMSFIICTLHQMLLRLSNQRERDGLRINPACES
jgi:hypothetical protein